jgi:hypothetical protein
MVLRDRLLSYNKYEDVKIRDAVRINIKTTASEKNAFGLWSFFTLTVPQAPPTPRCYPG